MFNWFKNLLFPKYDIEEEYVSISDKMYELYTCHLEVLIEIYNQVDKLEEISKGYRSTPKSVKKQINYLKEFVSGKRDKVLNDIGVWNNSDDESY